MTNKGCVSIRQFKRVIYLFENFEIYSKTKKIEISSCGIVRCLEIKKSTGPKNRVDFDRRSRCLSSS